jgi:hypothetical protein
MPPPLNEPDPSEEAGAAQRALEQEYIEKIKLFGAAIVAWSVEREERKDAARARSDLAFRDARASWEKEENARRAREEVARNAPSVAKERIAAAYRAYEHARNVAAVARAREHDVAGAHAHLARLLMEARACAKFCTRAGALPRFADAGMQVAFEALVADDLDKNYVFLDKNRQIAHGLVRTEVSGLEALPDSLQGLLGSTAAELNAALVDLPTNSWHQVFTSLPVLPVILRESSCISIIVHKVRFLSSFLCRSYQSVFV